MKIINRLKFLFFLLIAAYGVAACGGVAPSATDFGKGPKVDASKVAFTGIVEAMNGTQWTVSGQTLTLDPQVSLDPNIGVGDRVKVEANVSADGSVVALKIESPANDVAASTLSAAVSSDPSLTGTPSADLRSTPDVSSPSDPSSTPVAGNEIFGAVEAMTAETITLNGVTYNLANFTAIKDIVAVGDQVKLHLIVNPDGTFTVREIEKSFAAAVDDNSSTSNGTDDGANHDLNDDNSNNSGNGADDDSNHDSNDDNGGNGGNSGPGGG